MSCFMFIMVFTDDHWMQVFAGGHAYVSQCCIYFTLVVFFFAVFHVPPATHGQRWLWGLDFHHLGRSEGRY